MSALPDFLDFGRGGSGGSGLGASAGSPPVDGSRRAEASRSDAGRPSRSNAASPHILASPVHIGSPSSSHSPAPAQFPSSYTPAAPYAAPLSTSFVSLPGPGPSSAGTSTTSTYGTPSHYSPSPAPPPFDYSLNGADYSNFYGPPTYATTMPPAQHQQVFDGQTTLQWTEHITPPNPPPGAPDPATTHPHRIVQTHGNRDLTSASFQMMSGGWSSDGQKLGKPSGACTRCKKLKMKCDLKSGETKCQRCKGGDHECIPARRRPRRPRAVGPGLPLASEPASLAGPSPRRQHLQPTSAQPQQYSTTQYPPPQQPHMGTLQWTDPVTTYPQQHQQFSAGGVAAPGGYASAPYGHGQQQHAYGAPGYGNGQGADSRSPSPSRSRSPSRSPSSDDEGEGEDEAAHAPIRVIQDMANRQSGGEDEMREDDAGGDTMDQDHRRRRRQQHDDDDDDDDADGSGGIAGKGYFGSASGSSRDAKVQLPSFQQIASSTGATRDRRRSSAASKKDRDRDRHGAEQREMARRQPSTMSAGVQASGTEDEQEEAQVQRPRDNWDDDRATLVPALITEEQERELFQLFFDKININAALLDPRLHKYEYVRKRSAFLLTVMTAIASRYVTGTGLSLDGKKLIFTEAMARARRAAALTLVTAGKSVESCQAYILLTLFDKPTRPGEEDKGWQFSGLAIRMATDLNLHRLPPIPRELQTEAASLTVVQQVPATSEANLTAALAASPVHSPLSPPATSPITASSSNPAMAPSGAASALSPASTATTSATTGSGAPVRVTGPSHEIEQRVREHINRQRVWLVCFNLDRSLSTQFGRPNTVLLDFPGVRDWCYSGGENGRWNDPYDLTSCAFAEVMIAMTEFQKKVFRDEAGAASSGLALRGEDLKKLTLEYDTRIREICAVWKPRVEGHLPDYPGCSYRTLLWPFCVEYSRLVMFSFGFQEAFQTGTIASTEDFWFRECYNAAKTIVEVCVNGLAREPYFKYTFHSHYVYPTFAAAFLLKLLRPAFAGFLPAEQKETIVQLVRSAVEVFNNVAVDDGHAPKHYSRFLKNHLNKMLKGSGSASTSSGGRRKMTNASRDSHRNSIRQDSSGMQVDIPPQQRPHQGQSGYTPLQTGGHASSYDGSVPGSASSPSVSVVGTQYFSTGPSPAPVIESPPPQWNPYTQQMAPHGSQPMQAPMGVGGMPPYTSSLVPSGYGDTLQFTNPTNWVGNANSGMYTSDPMNVGMFGSSGPATGGSTGSFEWNPQVYAGPGLSNDWVTSDSLLMPGWHLQDQHSVFQPTMFDMAGPPIPINGHAIPSTSQQQHQQPQQSMPYGMGPSFS